MSAENSFHSMLNQLSAEMNDLYGYVTHPGDNFGEPAINSGPCGAFAHAFFKLWNQRFLEKVHIVFIMEKNSDTCWHVVIRLPDGALFDGGDGVHNEKKYGDMLIEDMVLYDEDLLEKRSYGLKRTYPRYCPHFSIHAVESIIEKYCTRIEKDGLFKRQGGVV